MTTLHPTPARLALLDEIADGHVFRDAIGDSYISGSRKVTAAVDEQVAAGWVEPDTRRHGAWWRPTALGNAQRQVRVCTYGAHSVAEVGPESNPRVIGQAVRRNPTNAGTWWIQVGDGEAVCRNAPTALAELRRRAVELVAAELTEALPPVWLLDVDGVVNARAPGWPGDPATGKAYAAGTGYVMTWAPALADRIRQLHTDGKVEVRWCTTWCAYAGELEQLWQLPPLGRAFTADVNGSAASLAKLAAARQVIADGRRLVWTDDTEVPQWGEVHDELVATGRALLIRPNGRCGLRSDDVAEIDAWARDGAK